MHFHEVGGIDAIVDIVGTAIFLEYRGIKRIIASHIPLGKGFVTCSHDKIPVPAPATLDILKGVPVYGTNIPHELVTPTGAAIIVTLAEGYGPMPAMSMTGVGYGAGQRELEDRPNLLRITTGTGLETASGSAGEIAEDHIYISSKPALMI